MDPFLMGVLVGVAMTIVVLLIVFGLILRDPVAMSIVEPIIKTSNVPWWAGLLLIGITIWGGIYFVPAFFAAMNTIANPWPSFMMLCGGALSLVVMAGVAFGLRGRNGNNNNPPPPAPPVP